MATHSSILAWKIPRTKESDELQPKGLQSMHAYTLLYIKQMNKDLLCLSTPLALELCHTLNSEPLHKAK